MLIAVEADSGFIENISDALNRRIAVLPGVFRQQFVGDHLAIGLAGDYVGERAAAVDPEFPLVG